MPWTEEEIKFLQDNIKHLTRQELATALNRKLSTVANKLTKLGLRSGVRRGCFQKGSTPWNKGLKGIHLSPATEFKKGNIPHGAKCNGFVSLRYHKQGQYADYYIRVAVRKWVPLRRYVWEQHNGPIPPGMVVRHKNGNQLDCSIDNLTLVSRSDNLRMNNSVDNRAIAQLRMSPATKKIVLEQLPELIDLKIAINKFSKTIKEVRNELNRTA